MRVEVREQYDATNGKYKIRMDDFESGNHVFDEYEDDGKPQALARMREKLESMITPESEQSPIMKFFEYEHLPEHLKFVSAPICELAKRMDTELKDSPEKSAGMRKLLEAKDCFVRARI
jgi:hypothetical protein